MDDRKRQKIMTSFGKKLREVREGKGISIRGLADLADIDYSNLNRIENGLVEISLCTIHAIAEALEIEPEELLKK
jgi:transcriptional regulator with XRE-family HTH domain